MEKRGFAISFQWIFAIIAGIIIFSFLIRFGYQQIFLTSKQTSLELLHNLDLQLDILPADVNKEIILKQEFEFTCDYIVLDNYKYPTEKIIFSPSKNINKLNIRSKTWSYPFKITNFYYISDAKFYLFNPPLIDIPETFNIIINPITFTKDAIFIFFTNPSQQQLEQAQTYSQNIKIIDTTKKIITFYPDKTISYLDDSFLYAAIFSPNYQIYTCLQQKALEKLKLIADLYKEKALFLQKNFPTCPYLAIADTLEQFKTNLNLKDTIITQNNLLKQNDCPALY